MAQYGYYERVNGQLIFHILPGLDAENISYDDFPDDGETLIWNATLARYVPRPSVSGGAGVANTDPRLSDQRTPLDGSVTNVKVAGTAGISLDKTVDSATRLAFTAAERTKLASVAAGATYSATDAQLRDRSTHTGTQPASTISDFTEAAQDAVANLLAAGTGVTLTYNDAGNVLTVTTTAQGGVTDPEVVRDTIGAALLGVGLVSVTLNDAADTITISTQATQNSTDAVLLSRTNHTGTQSADTVVDGVTNKAFLATERTKLTGIATSATANSTDAQLRDRTTHTGVQTSATISDLTETVQDIVAALIVAGANITKTYDDAAGTLTITAVGAGGTGATDAEVVRDTIAAALLPSGLVTILPNDAADTITIGTTATQNLPDAVLLNRGNHTGTQPAATISDFAEAAQDAVAAMLAAGSGVTLTYNDDGNTLVVTSTGSGGVTDPEVVRDTIGASLIGIGLVTVTLNDAADTITITTSATQNSPDAVLLNRTNHTGTQPSTTISDSTVVGRSVLSAVDAGAARTALGAAAQSIVDTKITTPAGGVDGQTIVKSGTGFVYANAGTGGTTTAATTTTAGIVRLATSAEAIAGTNATSAVTPAALEAATALDNLPLSIPGTIAYTGSSWPARSSVTTQAARQVIFIGGAGGAGPSDAQLNDVWIGG